MSDADTRVHKEIDTDRAVLRLEAKELKRQALTDRRVLDKLQNIPQSGTARQTAQTLHRRYQQAIERRCDLLETLLQSAEGPLTKRKPKMARTRRRRIKTKRLIVHESAELRKDTGDGPALFPRRSTSLK
jgi:hypothetical protein